jgi:hypothetical protein
VAGSFEIGVQPLSTARAVLLAAAAAIDWKRVIYRILFGILMLMRINI